MQKFVTILLNSMVVAVLVTPVMARNYKVPNNICWSYNFELYTQYITVGTKKGGWVRYQDVGKVSFYAVQGLQNLNLDWNLLSGSARTTDEGWMYMTFYSDNLEFNITWDLINKTGSFYYVTGSGGQSIDIDLTEVECKDLPLGGF